MEIKLLPIEQNRYPLTGIIIKSEKLSFWLSEIQRMGLLLKEIRIFPIPGLVPHSVWGALIVLPKAIDKNVLEQNNACQQVTNGVFIAERTQLFPKMTLAELENIFGQSYWLLHPEVGFCELTEIKDWASFISILSLKELKYSKPEKGNFIPREIKFFQIQSSQKEDVLSNLEAKYLAEKLDIPSEELNIFEKARLFIYQTLLTESQKIPFSTSNQNKRVLKSNDSFLANIKYLFQKKTNEFADYIWKDKEKLEQRNKKEMDKLLEMFNNNPLEALKYAIPLGSDMTRGSESDKFGLQRRWSMLNIFDQGNSRTSGYIDVGDYYRVLEDQYTKTAQDLINQKEYEKAAFVYLKLLKNSWMAAKTFEDGKMYKEAAYLYLQRMNNKLAAAEMFEKANMFNEALKYYKEENQFVKVAEILFQLKQYEEGNRYYQKVIDELINRGKYIEAAKFYIDKMRRVDLARNVLWQGWSNNNYNGQKCLEMYFSTFQKKECIYEIENVYLQINENNDAVRFIKVLKILSTAQREHVLRFREMVYALVARFGVLNPSITLELRFFSPENKNIIKDAQVFVQERKSNTKN